MIRPADSEDIARLKEIAAHSPSAAQWTEEQWRAALEGSHRRRIVLVLDCERSIAGFIVGSEVAGEWELENVAVIPEMRRRGFGKQLMQGFEALLLKSNAHLVFLEVRRSNSEARALYEMFGFEFAGTRREYYKDPQEDAIIYRKLLKNK